MRSSLNISKSFKITGTLLTLVENPKDLLKRGLSKVDIVALMLSECGLTFKRFSL